MASRPALLWDVCRVLLSAEVARGDFVHRCYIKSDWGSEGGTSRNDPRFVSSKPRGEHFNLVVSELKRCKKTNDLTPSRTFFSLEMLTVAPDRRFRVLTEGTREVLAGRTGLLV